MAKVAAKKKTALVKAESKVPANLRDKLAAYAGQGVSFAPEDNVVPLIVPLQTNSPQVNKRNRDKYIEGAEPGCLWLRNCAVMPLVDGETGFSFQLCHRSKAWVEWIPRDEGGGFVERHPLRPASARKTPHPKNPNRTYWTMPNGHELIETRYLYGIIWGGEYAFKNMPDFQMPFVISLSSTGHSVDRAWNTQQTQIYLAPGIVMPVFGSVWRITTEHRTNASGEWFVIHPSSPQNASEEQVDRGIAFAEACARGDLTAETAEREDYEDTMEEERL